MQQSSRYETILGRLGAYLACQEARRIEIADEGAYLTVSWLSQGAARRSNCFRPEEITRLQPSSRRDVPDPSSRAALLGALGRKLDESGMDVARIEEKTESFQISGATCGRYSNQRVSYWELRAEPAPRPVPAASIVPPVQAIGLMPSVVPIQPEPVAPVMHAEPIVPVVQPQSAAPSVRLERPVATVQQPTRTSDSRSGPPTEILSRELRSLPPPTSASPLRQRLQA